MNLSFSSLFRGLALWLSRAVGRLLLVLAVLTASAARGQDNLGPPDFPVMQMLQSHYGWGPAFGWPDGTNCCPVIGANWPGVSCSNGRVESIIANGSGPATLRRVFEGDLKDALSLLSAMREFNVRNCGFGASLDTFLVGEAGRTRIKLDGNRNLTGAFPDSFGRFNSLVSFEMFDTAVGGSLRGMRNSDGRLIRFQRTRLSGHLPPEWRQFNRILSHCMLEGPLPISSAEESLGNLVSTYQKFDSPNLTPGQLATQTIPPKGVQVSATTATSATLTWTPIAYTQHGGYYEVLVSHRSGGPYIAVGRTSDKTATTHTITGLASGEPYHFVVRTFTPAHLENPNDLTSRLSLEVATTLPTGDTALVTHLRDDGSPGSLRAALAEVADGGVVRFSDGTGGTTDFSDGTPRIIRLAGTPLSIAKNVSLVGPGASLLYLSGNGASRLFTIGAAGGAVQVTLAGLTLRDGVSTGEPGGAILSENTGSLTLRECVLSDNQVIGGDGGDGCAGGAVASLGGGELRLFQCTFLRNTADNGPASGGAIHHQGAGALSAVACTFEHNRALGVERASGGTAQGGAIAQTGSGILTLDSCTFASNEAIAAISPARTGRGGAVISRGGGDFWLVNCTLTGNRTAGGTGLGGAVAVLGAAPVFITHNTITENHAGGSTGQGGGLHVEGFGFTYDHAYSADRNPIARIANNIISGNSAVGGKPNVSGFVISDGHNLLGSHLDSYAEGTDLIAAVPQLAPLRYNGGPTRTRLPLPTSPARNLGDSGLSMASGLYRVDQRGLPRIVAQFSYDGGLNHGSVDAGACQSPDISGMDAVVGQSFTGTMYLEGGLNTPVTLAAPVTNLPPGLSATAVDDTIVITGTPETAGEFSDIGVNARFSDFFTNVPGTFALTVHPAGLSITTASLPNYRPGEPYLAVLAAEGGNGNHTWSLAPGSAALPAGLVLNPDGTLTGIPDLATVVTLNFQVESGTSTATRELVLSGFETPSLTVTTTADPGSPTDGQTSLREALAHAATLSGPQAITFSNSTANGAVNFHDGTARTITLGGTELVISSDVTLTGPGADRLSLSGDDRSRVFHVTGGTSAISGLTITRGRAPDGADNLAPFSTAEAGGDGGGIRNAGTLTLTAVTVSECRAGDGGDADPEIGTAGGAGGQGGGIHSTGTLNLSGCLIRANQAGTGGNQGSNRAQSGSGGGLSSTGILDLWHSTVTENASGANLTNSQVGNGGGLAVSGQTTIHACAITHNRLGSSSTGSREGGGLHITGQFIMTDSVVSHNDAAAGSSGGLYAGSNAQVSLIGCTLASNRALFSGAADFSQCQSARLLHCTLSGNVGTTPSIFSAAIRIFATHLTMHGCTVVGNTRGVLIAGVGGRTSTLSLGHCVLANPGENLARVENLGGTATLTSLGYNLSSDGSGPDTATDRRNTDPLLGPLQDNGGPTPTHALLAGSPAIDAGDPAFDPSAFDPALTTDQRGPGFPRVLKGSATSASARIDIGAYESAQVVPEIAVFDGAGTAPGDERADGMDTAAFGDQAVNTTSTARTFTIQNTGTDVLVLGTLVLAGDDAAQFTLTQPAATELLPEETTAFTVAFAPASEGAKTARVELPSNDTGTPLFRIPLSGTGTAGGPAAEPVDVAVSGSFMLPAQGLAGGGSLYRPLTGVINDAGRVALRVMGQTGTGGITSGSDSLLLSDVSGSLRVVAREGAVVRVSPWQTLTGSFAGLLVTDAGQVVFQDKIRGASAATDMGYFSSPDGLALELASREGDAAPGGGTFMTHTGSPAADAQGRVYFRGQVRGRPLTQDTGVWMRHGGTLTRLFAEGQNVASLTGDPAWAGQMGAFLAAGGHGAAFNAALQNNPVVKNQRTAPERNAAVFSVDAAANAALVARKGDPAPGAPGAQIFRFDGLARSSTGAHALRVLLRPAPAASDEALLFEKAGSLQLVAREGVTVVTGSVTVAKFGHYHVTAADEVVFLATLKGGGVSAANDGALCRWTEAGGIELLAREGAPAPGMGANYAVLQALSVSPGGAVLLQTTLSGGRAGLLRDTGAGMEKVTSTGDSILVGGIPRTILALSIHRDGVNPGGGGGGMGAAINDAGAVLSILSLGDGVHLARVWP